MLIQYSFQITNDTYTNNTYSIEYNSYMCIIIKKLHTYSYHISNTFINTCIIIVYMKGTMHSLDKTMLGQHYGSKISIPR